VSITADMQEKILVLLEENYQGTTTALEYNSPFELLIAVILSAQCTDTRVNIITSRLFPDYNSPAKMLALGQDRLEELIRDCGLYHSKARNILATCGQLCRDYDSVIPDKYEALITLPGVGRKTANVILSQLFHIPAIAVDTHVFRVSKRMGLANGDTPRAVEEGLMRLIPREKWGEAHHWLIWHGRKICKARRPECGRCPVNRLCPEVAKNAQTN
jgi:endonuclease III